MQDTKATLPRIRLIGSPVLHSPVPRFTDAELANLATLVVKNDEGAECRLTEAVAELHAVLDDFRAKNGFGRAIAANQIGFPLSIIAAPLPANPLALEDKVTNPAIRYTFVGAAGPDVGGAAASAAHALG
jgi:peptide deformylase